MCGRYLISLSPFDLRFEVLYSLVQASVAAQLRLHRWKIRTPLGLIKAMLVLLHPSQQVLDVAQGHVIQLGTHLHVGLLDGLCEGSLQAQVVITAQVYQTLVESINPIQKTEDGFGVFILDIHFQLWLLQ